MSGVKNDSITSAVLLMLYHRQRGRRQAAAIPATNPVTKSQESCNQTVLCDTIEPFKAIIVRPANRDWACQTERCNTLSNKTSLQ